MSAYQEIGFGQNDENLGSKSNRFKAKEGEKYRISFGLWAGLEDGKPNLDAPTPRFIGVKRLYIQGAGYFIDKGPEYVKLAGGPSKMAIGTIIIVWPTDSAGTLDKGRFQNGDFKVCEWIISVDKYRNIEQNHAEFPLGQHDLTLSCTDTQYQKITISPCRENLFRKILEKDGERAAKIIESIKAAAENLQSSMAADLTIDQIREKLGRGNASSPTGRASGTSGASGADFDNMLDDILAD